MKFLSKLLKNKKSKNLDYVDEKTGEVTKSAIIYDKNKDRLLKLDNDSCAIVIHSGGKVEVIFTHLYDNEKQRVTAEEETLMAIAMLIKQPGFNELIRTTFHNIAMKNISQITETDLNK
jgi:hypothetical protein